MVTIVLGSQWGDEGDSTTPQDSKLESETLTTSYQGRERSQTCCRSRRRCAAVPLVDTVCTLLSIQQSFQPFKSLTTLADAGHTIVHDNVTYDFHILPSGLVSPSCINLIGAGTVVHVPSFFKELAQLETKGLNTAGKRIFISDRAHVCFDLHSVVDGLEEAGLGGRRVGTTGKGIGPCYSDKAARRGVRIGEILDEETFERKLRTLDTAYRARFGELAYDVEEEIARFKVWEILEGKEPCRGFFFFLSSITTYPDP